MNRLKNYVLMAAGFAVLMITVGVFTAGHAIAQAVRAALVSNVDEPGRIPYVANSSCDFQSGDHDDCAASFPSVPAGKRLVITHVSGLLREGLPGGTLISTQIISPRGNVFLPVTYIGNAFGINNFVVDQPEHIICDAGASLKASVILGAFTSGSDSNGATFTFSGYLLDCTTGPCAAIAP
jgi:hypothetical protein